jgi:hypothetical protein
MGLCFSGSSRNRVGESEEPMASSPALGAVQRHRRQRRRRGTTGKRSHRGPRRIAGLNGRCATGCKSRWPALGAAVLALAASFSLFLPKLK